MKKKNWSSYTSQASLVPSRGEGGGKRAPGTKVKGSLQRPSGHTGYKVTMKIQNRLPKEHRWLNRTESESGTDKSNDKSLSLLQGLLEEW